MTENGFCCKTAAGLFRISHGLVSAVLVVLVIVVVVVVFVVVVSWLAAWALV